MFEALDLSPIEYDSSPEIDSWFDGLAALDPNPYRIGIATDDRGLDDESSAIVERGRDGRWWAGRYIGSITFEGRTLQIRPRLGIDVVERWLDQAFGLVSPPNSGRHDESDTFIVTLLARLWCRSIDIATRHGLPLLRLPQPHEGIYVRGSLDVRRTLSLMGQGREVLASTTYDRSLAHPVTRVIVCAERALADRLATSADWRTGRVKQVLPPMRASVGSRPRIPSPVELRRVRYTPITLPFQQAAELSYRIASHLGFSVTDDGAAADGLLIDVAELWELFVVNCTRLALPDLQIEHGTVGPRRDFLLQNAEHSRAMGRLKPDILVLDREAVVAVIDAKYKRVDNTRERPAGVDRADLYQLVAYGTRYKPAVLSALAYPESPRTPSMPSTAVEQSPWDGDGRVYSFVRLPVTVAECRRSLAEILTANDAP